MIKACIKKLQTATSSQLYLYLLTIYILMIFIVPIIAWLTSELLEYLFNEDASSFNYAISLYFIVEYLLLFTGIYITHLIKTKTSSWLRHLLALKFILMLLIIPVYFWICGLYFTFLFFGIYGCLIKGQCL